MTDEKTMTADEAIEEVTQLGEYIDKPTGRATDPPQGVSGISAQELTVGDAEFTLKRLGELAQKLVEDGAVPRDMKAGHVLMAMQAGLDHGLSWLGGIQGCVVIHGNFSWKGVAAAALIRNSPACKPGSLRFWSDDKAPDGGKRGVAVAWRVEYAEPDTRIFTMEDARRAELLGNKNWKHYPDRMLMWRALGLLARDIFSDVLGGFPLAEEAIDFEPKRGRAQVSVRLESPPPSGPDNLLDAIEGKAPAAKEKAADFGPEDVEVVRVPGATEKAPETMKLEDDDAAAGPIALYRPVDEAPLDSDRIPPSTHAVEGSENLCPHGIPVKDGDWVAGECEDCAREDKAAVLEAEAKEAKEQ